MHVLVHGSIQFWSDDMFVDLLHFLNRLDLSNVLNLLIVLKSTSYELTRREFLMVLSVRGSLSLDCKIQVFLWLYINVPRWPFPWPLSSFIRGEYFVEFLNLRIRWRLAPSTCPFLRLWFLLYEIWCPVTRRIFAGHVHPFLDISLAHSQVLIQDLRVRIPAAPV